MEKTNRKKKIFRLAVAALLCLIIISGLGIYFFWEKLPYQNEVSRQIQGILSGYGIDAKKIKVESISSSVAIFSNMQLGEKPALEIGRMTARYSIGGLRNGHVNLLGMDGAVVEVYQDKTQSWQIGGFESLQLPASEGSAFSPYDADGLRSKLPSGIVVANSTLQVNGHALEATIPFEGMYQGAPNPNISLQLPTVSVSLGNYGMTATRGLIDAELNPESKEWEGKIDAYKVIITGLPQEIPQMRLTGTFSANEKTSKGDFTLSDAKKNHHAQVAISIPNADPENGIINIKSLQFPYAGGLVRTGSIKAPLSGDAPVKIDLHFENLSLTELAALASGGKVQATGQISGTLPLTYYPDGKIILHDGTASAKESGMIIVSPENIPGGDREEIQIVRTALQNFHYTTLSLQVLSGADKRSIIQLKVEGNNPDAFGGKKVKLNVNLTGDILPMIQQSLQSLNDVGSLLRSETK